MRRHPFTKWAFTKWNLAPAALLAASGYAGGFGSGATAALSRAREACAKQLVIVDARLAQGDLAHCKQSGRARSGPTTYWDVGLETRRVADGQPLLVEPPAEDLRAVDVEFDCKTSRLIQRKSMDELITDSVGLVLAPFSSR